MSEEKRKMALCAQWMSQRHMVLLYYVEVHGFESLERLQSVTHIPTRVH